MFHKIESAKALSDFKLSVNFVGGVTKIYDIKPLFDKYEVFNLLKTKQVEFENFYVDAGGYGIVWNDKIDISSEELWENGEN